MKQAAEVLLGYKALTVRIEGLPHVIVLRSELLGASSWIDGRPHHTYCIELLLRGGVMRLEYDRRELWEAVLKGLDAALAGATA
jgi:hypothetical protein